MSDRLTRSTLRNLILETLQEASPWAHPAPARKPVVLAWGFDKRLSDKSTPESERIELLGQIVYKELDKIVDSFAGAFGSLEDDSDYSDDDIAGYIDDEESIGLWKSDRGRAKGESTYKAYEQAMKAIWDSARATAKMQGFDWDAVNAAIGRARDGAFLSGMQDLGYTLPPERYTRDQADDLKRSYGVDVPAGTVKTDESRFLRATSLSEAMSAGERGRGMYIDTKTVDKIKRSMMEPLEAAYYEVVDYALEDVPEDREAEDIAVATLQVVVDEAMKEFRTRMGHFDASSFAEAVERDAYDDDTDDDRHSHIDDYWNPDLNLDARDKILAAFYAIERAVQDGHLDQSVEDAVSGLMGHVGIFL